jgi:hypothetical protein
MKSTLLACLCLPFFLFGCASFSSTPVSEASPTGLMYHMPRRDITITVTVEKDKGVTDVVVGQTAVYADVAATYMLSHNLGLFTKHKTDVVVKDGLLDSSDSKVETKFADVIKQAASAAGTLGTKSHPNVPPKDNAACLAGTHVFILDVPTKEQLSYFCNNAFVVAVAPVGTLAAFKSSNSETSSIPGDGRRGVYYRQNLPYVFNVQSTDSAGTPIPGLRKAGTFLSPSRSPDLFLPIQSALFADAQSTFDFESGIPKQMTSTSDSELVSLFKIPADILTAYFTAAGSVFTQFNSRDTNEQAKMVTAVKLEMAKKKFEACLVAIADKKDDVVKALGCGV